MATLSTAPLDSFVVFVVAFFGAVDWRAGRLGALGFSLMDASVGTTFEVNFTRISGLE
jgi:hypothetical protein